MAKTQTLSNTEMAVMNLEVDIAQRKFSFFDQGFEEGEGIWYSCLRDEQNVSPKLAARAISALLKLGYFVKELKDEDGEQWLGLTEEGVAHYTKLAEVFKGESHRFDIVEEEAAPKAPKARKATDPSTNSGQGCKCQCGQATSGKGQYLPGHDAKHVSRLARTTQDAQWNAEVATLSTALRAKLQRSLSSK